MGCSLKVFEFRRSRHPRRWDPFVLGETIMDNGYIGYTCIHLFKWFDSWFFVIAFVLLAPVRSSGALSTCDLGCLLVCRVCSFHREDVLGGGIVVIPLQCEVYYR